jgi:hypothetical protein
VRAEAHSLAMLLAVYGSLDVVQQCPFHRSRCAEIQAQTGRKAAWVDIAGPSVSDHPGRRCVAGRATAPATNIKFLAVNSRMTQHG